MTIQEFLKNNTLLFDGSMGVYYQSIYSDGSFSEQANTLYPDRIVKIHREYLEAGATAIKTNTFMSNCAGLETDFAGVEANIRAAFHIASRAVEGHEAFLFADIGPLPPEQKDDTQYDKIIDVFLDLGAKNFLFETFTDFKVQPRLAKRIKEACPDAFIVTTFGAMAEGYTSSGFTASELIHNAAQTEHIDAAGLNCISGPAHLQHVLTKIKNRPQYTAVMPNAGYLSFVRGKPVYGASAEYFAARMAEIQAMGVKILGGCCGTTPEFICKTAEAIKHPVVQIMHVEDSSIEKRKLPVNRLADKLDCGKRVIAVELDPPADDQIDFIIDGARRLTDLGADAITIADCPIARARADSSMLAAKLCRDLGIEPIPHMTCRDRNLNATRALLLGLSIEEVHNVLVVTGDPVPTAEREKIKSVYNFNSVILSSYIRSLGEEGALAPFHVYGALNLNAKNFASELRKAQRKEESGVYGFLTQPIITEEAYENLKLAHETLKGHILGGIYPIVSERNAMFMNSEVAGIDVPQNVIDRYHGLDRQQGEDMAVQFTVEQAKRMLPYTSGWYITTPFKRIELMERIMKELSQLRDNL